MNKEDVLDAMLDDLNAGRSPEQQLDREEAELLAAAKMVKSLGSPAEVSPAVGRRIVSSLPFAAASDAARHPAAPSAVTRRPARRMIFALGGVAAALVLFLAFSFMSGMWNRDVAYAMSRAVSKIAGYHGVLEKSYRTSAGDEQVVRRVEIWSWAGGYATRLEDGTLTVNNGQAKWQVRPSDKTVALLPLVPDPERSGLDLRMEAERALKSPHVATGEELIAGRKAVRLEVTPDGGQTYEIWVDSETDLPLQLRTAVQNSMQTTYTYTEFDAASRMNDKDFAYAVPEGYEVVEKDPGQIVSTPAEAAGIAGFTPVLTIDKPARIFAHASGKVVLDYGDSTVTETRATGVFVPATHGALGAAAGGPLEILEGSLRWRQGALEITTEGDRRLELAKQIAPDLTLPSTGDTGAFNPKVKVAVDMEAAKNDQKQVDGGHSPWQLDPLSVSLTFVNLKVTPDGIVGEPTIAYEQFSIEQSDGTHAIVKVAEGPVLKVYLERLVRQDDTGIWSVVGYDPR